MYIIEIENNGVTELLHEMDPKSLRRVVDCEFTDSIDEVDTATIEVPLQNPAYANLHELKTFVRIINTKTGEVEFDGYVFHVPEEAMENSGIVSKKITCESILGYLCNSVQPCVQYNDTDVTGFLASLLDYHNKQMEWYSPERRMFLGACTVHDDKNKSTVYRSTMEEIKQNLISDLGGILHTRRNEDNQIVLDYYQENDFGQICDTSVEIAVNMKSISVGTDTTGVITRLYPLGCQINNETGQRLTIADVNKGWESIAIDDEDAIAKYGVICGTYIWDDITDPDKLLEVGKEYLKQACQIKKSYQGVVLDLSTIGKAADSFRAGNTYPFFNPLIKLDEYLKIIRRTVNIFRPYQPTIEIGDKMEKITDVATQTRNYIQYEIPKQRSEILQQAKDNASALITSATHGYVVVEPEEILIMNTDSKETATKIWRFNINGLGYSHSDEPGEAYNGEYGLAMTMDGAIVADYITTGTMYADRIKGGTLTVGGYNNDNGVINVRNSSGEVICLFDSNGADILGSIKTRSPADYWLRLDNGSMVGGHGGEVYTTINATAVLTNNDTNTDYHGLLVNAGAIDFRCDMFAINGWIGATRDLTYVKELNLYQEEIPIVKSITDNGDGTISWVSGTVKVLTHHDMKTRTESFQNGILYTVEKG